jgi:hypothetical protein
MEKMKAAKQQPTQHTHKKRRATVTALLFGHLNEPLLKKIRGIPTLTAENDQDPFCSSLAVVYSGQWRPR